jgi:hypothetical protein
VAVVLESDEAESVDEAVSGIACDDVDFFLDESAVDQAEIENTGRFAELQAIALRPALVAVGAFEELVADAGAPVRSKGCDVGKSCEVIGFGVVATNDHREGVFEAERFGNVESETASVFFADALVDGARIALGFFAEDGGERGAGVLDVKIDIAAEHGFVNEKSAAEIGFAFDGNAGAGFDVLGEEFGEDDLFGEEFGGDDEVGFLRGAAGGEEEREKKESGKKGAADHFLEFSAMGGEETNV